MKKTLVLVALAGLLAVPAFAAEKQVTITGQGMCAKCDLHQAKKCQTVIQTQKDGKTVTYWLAQNSTSKQFHKNVCRGPEKVAATGTVSEHNGKKVLTVTKIAEAK